MSDPFDVPDVFDDEEEKPKDGDLPVPDPFDVPDVDLAEIEAAVAAHAEPQTATDKHSGAPKDMPWYEQLLMGVGDGASFGHGDTLGRLGANIGDAAANALRPQPAATKVGRTAGDMGAEIADAAGQSTAGQAGRVAGAVAASVPLAGAAGPSVLGQAAMGAAQGAAQAHGDDESMLGGGLAGGALGTLGGAVAKGATALGSALKAPANPALINGASQADEALLALANSRPSLAGSIMEPWKAVKNATGTAGISAAAHADKAAPALRATGQLGAKAAGGWFGDEMATPLDWAVQSVLSSGKSGLSPQDEERMTAAVLSGDKDKLAPLDFAAQMKSPRYQAQVRKQLQSLQGTEE